MLQPRRVARAPDGRTLGASWELGVIRADDYERARIVIAADDGRAAR
jgi:hypothetical protein